MGVGQDDVLSCEGNCDIVLAIYRLSIPWASCPASTLLSTLRDLHFVIEAKTVQVEQIR
jgi:hypothetical protein